MKIKKLINCARCGKTHEDLEFKELTNPIVLSAENQEYVDFEIYTHFCLCPTNQEPILLNIVDE